MIAHIFLRLRIGGTLALLIILTATFRSAAQPVITLQECYRNAQTSFPLQALGALNSDINLLKINNLNKNYLPKINAGANVSLQSEVTKVDITLPLGLPDLAMPEISKDWYKLTLDLTQTIYDGNITRYQKQLEEANLRADLKGVEAALWALRERVNQLFFGILLIDRNEKLLLAGSEKIRARIREVNSAIASGAVPEMNLRILEAELIRLEQQTEELKHDRKTSCRMLSELTSIPIDDNAVFQLPEIAALPDSFENRRPEYNLFDIQRDRIDLLKKMVVTKWNPKVAAYGQAGYGRPGLNMLDSDFRPWWIIGARVTWSPWNWNENKNERKILSLQSEIVRTQQESFDRNLRISAHKESGETAKMAALLDQDRKIIALRESVTQSAASQLDNGVITPADYIARLNEETTARINYELHQLQLVRARITWLYTTGMQD